MSEKDIKSLKLPELQDLAKNNNIDGYKKMKKGELVDAITIHLSNSATEKTQPIEKKVTKEKETEFSEENAKPKRKRVTNKNEETDITPKEKEEKPSTKKNTEKPIESKVENKSSEEVKTVIDENSSDQEKKKHQKNQNNQRNNNNVILIHLNNKTITTIIIKKINTALQTMSLMELSKQKVF